MTSNLSANPTTSADTPSVHRRFNHDLLISEDDQKNATERWPAIARVLIDQELIKQFIPYENGAKRDKKIVQRVGTLSVLLMMVALLGAARELTLGNPAGGGEGEAKHAWYGRVSIGLEVAAIGGLVCALLASRFGPFRRRWLKQRFATEVLRQWHFRRLLDGPAIEKSDGKDEREPYEKAQKIALASLVHNLEHTVGQMMDPLVKNRADPLGRIPSPKLARHAPIRREMLAAYRELRLKHQLEFAEYKLSPDDRTFIGLSGDALVKVTDMLSGTTLVLALGISVCHPFFDMPWAPFAAVALVIGGVVVRTWRDGLSLGEERERYQEMQHRLELLTTRWESTADEDERFSLAEELEQAALEELRGFIREHEKAQFLI